MRFKDFLILGLWWGVVAGFLEIAKCKFSGVRQLRPMVSVDEHLWWLAPLGNAVVFMAIGCLLYLARILFPRLLTLRRSIAVFFFLACLNVLLMADRLAAIAVVILSMGLAKVATDIIFCSADGRFAAIGRLCRRIIGVREVTPLASQTTGSHTATDHSPATADSPGEVVDQAEAVDANTTPDYEVDRRTALVTAAAALGAPLIGVNVWNRLGQGEQAAAASAANGEAPKSKQPNVLLVVLDTVRARNLSLYGYERETTPHLERFAKRGICYDWAIAEAPWTLPSHASMFSGQHAHDLSCGYKEPFDSAHATLAEELARQGYATSGFVANLAYCAKGWGLERGFEHYDDLYLNFDRVLQSSNLVREVTGNELFRQLSGMTDYRARPKAPHITDRFLQWHDKHQDQPYFAFLNYFDAHGPYLPPEPFASKFGATRPPFSVPVDLRRKLANKEPGWLSREEIDLERNAYDGCLAYLDQDLGRLFDQLAERGTLDDTLVIVVGDHGEEFSEHGCMWHGASLYLSSLHVPLIMSLPGRLPENQRTKTPVSLRDLPSTVMSVLGLQSESPFPGTSFEQPVSGAPQFSSTRQVIRQAPWWPSSQGDMRSVCHSEYHYIQNGDGREELYHYVDDPLETKNLIAAVEGRSIAADCRRLLEESSS